MRFLFREVAVFLWINPSLVPWQQKWSPVEPKDGRRVKMWLVCVFTVRVTWADWFYYFAKAHLCLHNNCKSATEVCESFQFLSITKTHLHKIWKETKKRSLASATSVSSRRGFPDYICMFYFHDCLFWFAAHYMGTLSFLLFPSI